MPSDSGHLHDPLDFDREDAPFLHSDNSSNASPIQEPKRHHHYRDHGRDRDRHYETPSIASSGNKLRLRLLITLFVIVLAVEMGLSMSDSPMVRIYESITCRKHYLENDPGQIGADGQVQEELCKVTDVQTELAAVKGYMECFDGLLSVFLAIPYGLLADRHGRRSTICLSIPGFLINAVIIGVVLWFSDVFPLRAVWVSSLAWILGGGPVVAFAIVWTMLSDVTKEDERYILLFPMWMDGSLTVSSASIFFKYAIVLMGGELVSNAASSWLMAFNPWIPMLLGWTICFVGMLCSLTLPETMPASPSSAQQPEMSSVEMGHLDPNDNDDERAPFTREKPSTTSFTTKRSIFTTLYTRIRAYFAPYAFIFRKKQILLLFTAFLVYRLSRGSSWFLVQYISTRYAWTLAQANFLMSLRSCITIPLFIFILPGISKYVLRRFRTSQKNLYLARGSVFCLTLGTLGVSLSPNIPTFILSMIVQASGAGFIFLIRALLTVLVKREETARVFTIMELLQSVGNVIASLSITKVFQIGLELGGVWVGLAWMMTSTAFALVGVSIWLFELPPVSKEREGDAEREARL